MDQRPRHEARPVHIRPGVALVSSETLNTNVIQQHVQNAPAIQMLAASLGLNAVTPEMITCFGGLIQDLLGTHGFIPVPLDEPVNPPGMGPAEQLTQNLERQAAEAQHMQNIDQNRRDYAMQQQNYEKLKQEQEANRVRELQNLSNNGQQGSQAAAGAEEEGSEDEGKWQTQKGAKKGKEGTKPEKGDEVAKKNHVKKGDAIGTQTPEQKRAAR